MSKWVFIFIVIFSFSCKNDSNEKTRKIESNNFKKLNKDSLGINIVAKDEVKLSSKVLFIKSFYEDYIFEHDKVKDNPSKKEAILDKYCSVELIKRYNSYEYLDYNPFINGQDYGENFLDNLKIKHSDTKLNYRYTIYQTHNGVDYELLQMQMIEKENSFKINNLYFLDGSEMLSMQSDK